MQRRLRARDARARISSGNARFSAVAGIAVACLGAASCNASESPNAAPNAHASAPVPQSNVAAPHAAPPPAGTVEGEPRPAATTTSAAPEFEYSEITTGRVHGDDKAPLIIALHGLGDTPRGFLGLFDGFTADARIVAPHSKTSFSEGFSWFPPGNGTSDLGGPALSEMASRVATFITLVASRRPTLGKPIVVGFSQGGALSLTIGALHPGVVATAIPLSGWLPPSLWPSARPTDAVPILAFHGTADARVPFAGTRAAIAHLVQLGYPASLHEIDGVGHGISPLEHEALFEALVEACAKEAH